MQLHFHFLLFVIFPNSTGFVSIQQQSQFLNTGLQFLALVGFGNFHAGVHFFKDNVFVLNIVMLLNGGAFSYKRLVGNNPEMTGAENQRVTCDTGGGLVSLAEATVDDDEPAAEGADNYDLG